MSKKAISAILAVMMALSAFAPALGTLAVTYPYVERDDAGNVTSYHRLSNGEDVSFNVDYDAMVQYVRSALINHETDMEYFYATTDEAFAYDNYSEADKPAAQQTADALYDKLINDVFEINSTAAPVVGGGEYLFNSIKNIEFSDARTFDIGNVNTLYYLSSGDVMADGTRYYTFHITINDVAYYSTLEMERMTNSFASWFSTKYLDDTMTEYQMVKTIYDFIVRNTTYDWDVMNFSKGDTTLGITDERYNVAHSAYGAILGNILSEYDLEYIQSNLPTLYRSKNTVTNERVPINADRGLAVCEGYSKLFYYLCTYNGIRCHIVDGDYIESSGKDSDAHEWNFVYLQDESGDGYKWFQVDCTRAAQNSVKQIDLNNYNYFLGGYESVYFGYKNHQQAYENKGTGLKPQLYDWWNDTANCSSIEDYVFAKVTMYTNNLAQGYIVKRSTHYSADAEETVAYIYYDRYGAQIIEITEEGVTLSETDGFVYTGYESSFTVIVPYIVNRINVLDDGNVSEGEYTTEIANIYSISAEESSETAVETGSYVTQLFGADGTSLDIDFSIVPRNMSKEYISNNCIIYNPESASYTGKAIVPAISVTDPKNNNLVEGRDYTISYLLNGALVDEIKNIGDYTININFKGNYRGTYPIEFTVGKVDLSALTYDIDPFQYYPEYYRKQNNMNTPYEYYSRGVQSGITVGELTIYLGKDFTATCTGDLEYGTKRGTITLRGISGTKVDETKSLTVSYDVTKKYDISVFDGKVADTNTTNKVYYSGSAVKPTKFDWLDERLVRGKDYEITGYSNNTEAGYAYVHIKGIGGCTGTAKMQFYINPVSQQGGSGSSGGTSVDTSGYVKPTTSGNTIKLSATKYTYDGKAKKPTVAFKNSSGKAINTYYYTVSYKSNTNPGTAYVVIKLRNGYAGTFNVAFTINPKGTAVSKLTAAKKAVTVKWTKQNKQTTGYQIQYATSSSFSGAKTVTVSKNSTVSKKITGLKAKKKYYIRIRTYKTVNGKKYYSSWSKAKNVKTK